MKRLTSIDATRGLVMLLMLVDHTREFFYMHEQVSDPVNVLTTSPQLFFTRLSAHLCAPVFVLLTGLAALLYQSKTNKKEASIFLLKRGLFLMFLEITLINFGWSFSLIPQTLFLQVIWAIGLSMVTLSALLWLPMKAILGIGITIILAHNLLDPITFHEQGLMHTLWAILHDRSYVQITDLLRARTSYPLLPWIGVIALGYSLGPLFQTSYSESKRQRQLTGLGVLSLLLFIVLRLTHFYGDSSLWQIYDDPMSTIVSFFNVTKYPPSLQFLLLTLGFGFIILALLEKKLPWKNILSTFGSVPMFFYIIHIYLIHLINKFCILIWGTNQGQYFSFSGVWGIWIFSMILAVPLWFVCRWYGDIKRKSNNPILKYF